MSQAVLMLTVRDHLRLAIGAGTPSTGLGFDSTECDVMFDGQPYPMAGERFVAVHGGGWSNSYDEGRLDEIGIEITVSRRCAYSPQDRAANALYDATVSLDKIVESVIAKVHSNYVIMTTCNTTLGALVNGFYRPLFFRSCSPPMAKGYDWFNADPPEGARPAFGVARQITFAGAERGQTIESQG